ncbi:hypothetical protein ABIE41_001431 [Bosea sp. OAE506]|uniref:polysaccharide deacetylase n=1 Tax=Bosea sp. OAE506 TaxID=2663870 RepID=UPI00178B9CF1
MTTPLSDLWGDLQAELDRWGTIGGRIRLWLRDDDAIADSPALDALSALAERHGLPVLLAVIPMLAEPSLGQALRRMPLLLPCQHGTWHRNHAKPPAKKAEFGPSRSAPDLDAEIATAWRRLGEVLEAAPLPVFVPPWNRIDPAHAARLPGLGFAGLSCFRGYRLGPEGGPRLANTQLDIMDWTSRTGRRHADLVEETCRLLAAHRLGGERDIAFGVLLHHRDHDDTAWAFLQAFLAAALVHPAVLPGDPRQIFELPLSTTAPDRRTAEPSPQPNVERP